MNKYVKKVKICCAVCGKKVVRTNGRQKYCPGCSKKLKRGYSDKWHKKHPYYEKYPERKKGRNLKVSYGITLKDYNIILVKQKGCCAICGRHQFELSRALDVDHNHKTGKIRGLLCQRCNIKLATVEDLRFIKLAKKYLKRN